MGDQGDVRYRLTGCLAGRFAGFRGWRDPGWQRRPAKDLDRVNGNGGFAGTRCQRHDIQHVITSLDEERSGKVVSDFIGVGIHHSQRDGAVQDQFETPALWMYPVRVTRTPSPVNGEAQRCPGGGRLPVAACRGPAVLPQPPRADDGDDGDAFEALPAETGCGRCCRRRWRLHNDWRRYGWWWWKGWDNDDRRRQGWDYWRGDDDRLRHDHCLDDRCPCR
ncbi:hypothetical protein HC928_19395 [bacterium]|nr:hypothetical protein [bacterium]